MNRFKDIQASIFSLFTLSEWTTHSINTYPANFIPDTAGQSYIRIKILPSSIGIDKNSKRGIILIDIFTLLGTGPSDYMEIADKLNSLLENKVLTTASGVVQLSNSAMADLGIDPDNQTLYRVQYSIPFNYYGV